MVPSKFVQLFIVFSEHLNYKARLEPVVITTPQHHFNPPTSQPHNFPTEQSHPPQEPRASFRRSTTWVSGKFACRCAGASLFYRQRSTTSSYAYTPYNLSDVQSLVYVLLQLLVILIPTLPPSPSVRRLSNGVTSLSSLLSVSHSLCIFLQPLTLLYRHLSTPVFGRFLRNGKLPNRKLSTSCLVCFRVWFIVAPLPKSRFTLVDLRSCDLHFSPPFALLPRILEVWMDDFSLKQPGVERPSGPVALPRMANVDQKDIPPPTPVTLPHDHPDFHRLPPAPTKSTTPLVKYLQSISRSSDVTTPIFEALGVHVIPVRSPRDLIPDPAYIPDFDAWDQLSPDEAQERNDETKRPLNTGAQSPGCQTYQDRKRELSIDNEDAFRVVTRTPPPTGKQPIRLGNSREFFNCLESIAGFWDDTPRPQQPVTTESPETDKDKSSQGGGQPGNRQPVTCRTAAGASMPHEYRLGLVHGFLKLVAYDFGCSPSPSRVEPRLHLKEHKADTPSHPAPRNSYIPSTCTFIFRSPRSRDEARKGLVDGPIAAISARATTNFAAEIDHNFDFARELIAALLTAQHRAREGKTEQRPGQGQWWTTRKRWGGGSGGPIGREIERAAEWDAAQGGKDGPVAKMNAATATVSGSSSGSSPGMPAPKRPRKQMSIYDSYRMIRPPSASWDPRTRYEAIGKVPGSGYDDIFLVSCLFHHVSVLRVRVPDRLLEVLQGASEGEEPRSWGELEVRRTPWFDLFLVEERLEALKIVWAVMAWMMRKPEEENRDGDVTMVGT
ncbi:hypothetical protein SODALDRAFT_354917 [Sodiomyces alkalinus F11]|uniref:Uncharacterized protein n=1 Tax=Sodiomyces alkalinus (strain CBS 110278 / VKM F-3762 / F11) TaxID=1314773 RepID=A0A3N2Q7L2_SODAK|nr:hypothetical protein SODALDRAFT_354917 [Sodiomyces alkalinus F11]ROT42732.1 hypothetical protein SODALDRAFT_354917 [Sodiomyces alkalinus F11]